MSTKREEKALQRRVLHDLISRGGFWSTPEPSPCRGIPDIIGCYRGSFVTIELKRERSCDTSPDQDTVHPLIEQAGGICNVCTSAWEVMAIIDAIDGELDDPEGKCCPVTPAGVVERLHAQAPERDKQRWYSDISRLLGFRVLDCLVATSANGSAEYELVAETGEQVRLSGLFVSAMGPGYRGRNSLEAYYCIRAAVLEAIPTATIASVHDPAFCPVIWDITKYVSAHQEGAV